MIKRELNRSPIYESIAYTGLLFDKERVLFIITEKVRNEKDKDPHTLGGGSYILSLYINSVKEVVIHLEVELYKPRRYIS